MMKSPLKYTFVLTLLVMLVAGASAGWWGSSLSRGITGLAVGTSEITEPNVSAEVVGSDLDRAGTQGVFEPGPSYSELETSDWRWQITLTLPSTKTISAMQITNTDHIVSDDTWSTYDQSLYPLVVFYNGKQLNSSYSQRNLGTYNAGTHTFNAYGQIEDKFTGGALVIKFSDDTTVSAKIPASALSAQPPKLALSASLVSAGEDRISATFESGAGSTNNAADWGFKVFLSTPITRSIKSMKITHPIYGEAWSSATYEGGRKLYPLAIYYNDSRLNSAYDQQLGTYNAGTHKFIIYAQTENTPFNGGVLTVTFMNGETTSATIAPSGIKPAEPSLPPVPACTSKYRKVCDANTNSVMWQDSCGKIESVAQACGTDFTCTDGTCIQIVRPNGLSASLATAREDRAGVWGVFNSGKGQNGIREDWKWSALLTLGSQKTIKSIRIKHNTYGEGWSSASDTATYDKQLYPLVVYYNGTQLNTAYDQQIGPFAAGEHKFILYGQTDSANFTGGRLLIYFTDGTSVDTQIGASDVAPPSQPPEQPSVNCADHRITNMKISANDSESMKGKLKMQYFTPYGVDTRSTITLTELAATDANTSNSRTCGIMSNCGQQQSGNEKYNCVVTTCDYPTIAGKKYKASIVDDDCPYMAYSSIEFTVPDGGGNTSTFKAYLASTNEDHAGTQGVFGPGVDFYGTLANDYHWVAKFSLDSDKYIKSILLVHNTPGEAWSTSSEKWNGKDLYPIVVLREGGQKNKRYDEKILVSKGDNTLDLYGQIESRPFAGGKMEIQFTDGTALSATIDKSGMAVVPLNVSGMSCSDTDGGVNKNVAGTIKYTSSSADRYAYTDYCINDRTIAEGVCGGNAYPAKQFVISHQKCDGSCVDGACIGATPPQPSKLLIEEFTDFECPFCARFATVTKPKILEEYGTTVGFLTKEFPLTQLHSKAWKAAEAAECARDQGRFEEYYRVLFIGQADLDISNIKNMAAKLGLDTGRFNACLDSGMKKSIVQKDYDEGISRGVSATPTFFIGSERIDGALEYGKFKEVIERQLSGNGGPSDEEVAGARFLPNIFVKTIAVSALTGEGYVEISRNNGQNTQTEKYFEGDFIKAIKGTGDYTGSEMEIKVVQVTQQSNSADYIALFELYYSYRDGNILKIVDAQKAQVGKNLKLVFRNTGTGSTGGTGTPPGAPPMPVGKCSEGETRNYKCSDGSEILWCSCLGGDWRCVQNPQSACRQQQPESACNGCADNGKCLSAGTRFGSDANVLFCDIDSKVKEQKSDGSLCQNSYECKSNSCLSGVCVNIAQQLEEQKGVLQQIVDFLSKIFKFEVK